MQKHRTSCTARVVWQAKHCSSLNLRLRLFGHNSSGKVMENQMVYFLLQVCLELELVGSGD